MGRHLVSGGSGDGRIYVWRLDLTTKPWTKEKILDVQAHDGPVTAVAFAGETRIAAGGADRAIVLTKLADGDNQAGVRESRFQLTIRYRGMKIRGIKGTSESAQLNSLIAQCAKNTPRELFATGAEVKDLNRLKKPAENLRRRC
jgi:WD40 repeat protein